MKTELPLHDAVFDGLVMQGPGCTLYFTNADGTGCEVELIAIDALQMDDFREGNIVVLFETTTGEPPRSTINLERLYPPPHSSAAEEYHSRHRNFQSLKTSAIATGELTLVEMQPAIGADLLVTCKQVQLKSRGIRNR
jgi:hypothetical protein